MRKKEKQTSDESIVFGLRAILEAISSGRSIDKLFIQEKTPQKAPPSHLMRQLLKAVNDKEIAVSYVPAVKLDKLSKYQNHQGAVAKMALVGFTDLEGLLTEVMAQEKTNPFFLVLDGVTDVRNFGAIIRSAVCTDMVAGIVIAQTGSAPVNAEVAKTSSGGLFHIPICKVPHIKDALFLFQSHGLQIVATSEKASTTAYQTNFSQPTALIMGGEEKGLHRSVLKMADATVALPIYGAVASLNVSVAAGVLLYEALRQRSGDAS